MTTRRIPMVLAAAFLLAGGAGTALWMQDRGNARLASELHRDLAESAPDAAVELRIWQASEPVRERLTELLEVDPKPHGPTRQRAYSPESVQRGLSTGWARAQAGLDDPRIRDALRLLRTQWFSNLQAEIGLPPDGRASYALLWTRLADPAALRQEADALRELLLASQDTKPTRMALELLLLYADIAVQFDDPEAIRAAEQLLRERLHRIGRIDPMQYGLEAHARLLARLDDSRLQAETLATLRERMAGAMDWSMAMRVSDAYLTVADALTDPALIRAEATELRTLMARECSTDWTRRFLLPHRLLAAKQTDAVDLAPELASLRKLLQVCTDPGLVIGLMQSHRKVAESLNDPTQIQAEVEALRALWSGEADERKAAVLASAYTSLLSRQADPAAVAEAAAQMRARLDRRFVPELAAAYAMLLTASEDAAARSQLADELHESMSRARSSMEILQVQHTYLTLAERLDPVVLGRTVAMLRERLTTAHERGVDESLSRSLAMVYGRLVAHLRDPEQVAAEVAALRQRLDFEVDEQTDQDVLRAFAELAVQLDDPAALREAARLLRTRPSFDWSGSFERQPVRYIAGLAPAGMEDGPPRSPHARVLANLTEPAVVAEELLALRAKLLGEGDPRRVHTLAQAYAVLAGTAMAEHQHRGDLQAVAAEVRQVLVLAGHPFLAQPEVLLSALEPIAGQRFGMKVGAAVSWWRNEFDGDPAGLRPGVAVAGAMPIPRRILRVDPAVDVVTIAVSGSDGRRSMPRSPA